MAGGSTTQNNCDGCGKLIALTVQRCASCITIATAHISSTWYPTFKDERDKTNGKT